MSIQIYEWDEMIKLSLDEKNETLQKLTNKVNVIFKNKLENLQK